MSAYLVAGAALAALATLIGRLSGLPSSHAAGAAVSAFGLQTMLAVPLVRRLRAGGDVTAVWILGIACRMAALAVAWLLVASELLTRDAAVVFGLTLSALLILEAFWLAATTAGKGTQGNTRK